jgi:hypothetical protein
VPQFLLIGLCEPPSPDQQAAFDEWFVDQHIEDTAHCPNFIRGRVYKLAGPHLTGKTPSNYISVYEVDAPSYEEAERVLNEWQANPNAWAGRGKHLETAKRMGGMPLKILGSGWYELLRAFDGPKA